MKPKVAALLGFAAKAKKLVSGESAVEAILKKGRGRLLVVAADVSEHIRKKYSLWCNDLKIPMITGGTKVELGLSIGLSPRSVIVVTDDNFAASILKAGGFVE